MASITITEPTQGSTVQRMFPARGGYTTSPGGPPQAPASRAAGTLDDSGGGVIQVQYYQLPGPTPPPSGNWDVMFDVAQDYPNCTITAQLELAGGSPPYPTASVGGINIVG